MEQQNEDRYDLVHGILLSCATPEGNNDHACNFGALFERVRKVGTRGRLGEACPIPSVRVRSTRTAPRLAARRKAVKGNAKRRSSSAFTSEESALEK